MLKQGKNAEKKRPTFFNGKTVLVFLLLLLMTAATGLIAKYIWVTESDYSQVNSTSFYFTAEVLGDSEMTESEDGTYSYEEKQIGNWHLYGGGAHEISIDLQNYYDELRITQKKIIYSVNVVGNASVSSNKGSLLGAKDEEGKYGKDTDTLKLTIPSGYSEGDKVVLTIESTKPYKKIIELNFTLHVSNQGLTYRIIDSVGSPYAELEIMNGTNEEKSIILDWSATSLFIDNTNELTFQGNFVQQDGMTQKKMALSRALKPDESVSIYFFKSDNKNYACPVTIVQQGESSGSYIINIRNHA